MLALASFSEFFKTTLLMYLPQVILYIMSGLLLELPWGHIIVSRFLCKEIESEHLMCVCVC